MAYGRLSHARGPTGRLPTIYILNHQISLLTLNRSVDSAVRALVCSRMYTPCIRIHHMVSPECRMSSAPTSRNTVNPQKLSSMVTTDKKEYIHHTINLSNTSLPYKTIHKTTNKNGLGAIKPRQRPNRSPTNYLYTKPSNQSTHPQSIRRFSRPSPRVQPYVYGMHQNPSHGFAKAQNVIGANLRNTVNEEKLSLMVTTDKQEYIHHNDTIHRRNTSLPYKKINKTTNKNGLGAIKPR